MRMNKKASILLGIAMIILIVVAGSVTLYAVSKIGTDGGTTIINPNADYPPAGIKICTKDKYNSILTDTCEWAIFPQGITNYAQAYRDQDYLVCCASGTADTPDATGLITAATWGTFKTAATDLGIYSKNQSYIVWSKRDASYESGLTTFQVDWETYDQGEEYQVVKFIRDALGTIDISTAANTTNSTTDCTTTCKTKSDVKGRIIMVITGTVASYDGFSVNGGQLDWTYDGTNYYHVFSSMPSLVVWEFENTLTGGAMDVDVKFYREDEYGRCDGFNHDSTVIQTIDCIVT